MEKRQGRMEIDRGSGLAEGADWIEDHAYGSYWISRESSGKSPRT